MYSQLPSRLLTFFLQPLGVMEPTIHCFKELALMPKVTPKH